MASRVQFGASHARTCNKNSYENTHIFDKTRLCKFYAKGKCKRGQACTFAHGGREVQAQPDFFKTQLCVDFVRSGVCESGSDCRFAHSAQELRRAKTNKNSLSKGVKKPADPQVSFEVQRLEMMHQEVARLQSHLHSLHMVTGSSVPGLAPAPEMPGACKAEAHQSCKTEIVEASGSSGPVALSTGFSRQSTEEGQEPPECFSRQSTNDRCDTSDDSVSAIDSEVAQAEKAKPSVEETPCEVFVKHTFISLQEVKVGAIRRTQSVPAARRLGLGEGWDAL